MPSALRSLSGNTDLPSAVANPISWYWVKGHASAKKRPDELTFPEILNETADELATKARRSKNITHADDEHWPEQTVCIIGARGRMCGHVSKELRYCCTAPNLLSYWKDRFRWSESQVALVDLLGTQKPRSSGAVRYQSIGGCGERTLTD
jgi:hypothetical protein